MSAIFCPSVPHEGRKSCRVILIENSHLDVFLQDFPITNSPQVKSRRDKRRLSDSGGMIIVEVFRLATDADLEKIHKNFASLYRALENQDR